MTMWLPRLAETDGPLYLALADALERDIRSSVLKRDARLPTHRKLARALGVSVGTVTRAYSEAEARGLIRGEIGRGTYVGGRTADARFPTARGDRAVLDLAVTWPLHALDPDLRSALLTVAAQPHVQALLRYAPHAGHDRHREAGALWAGRHGVDVGGDSVVVCSGVQHALSVALTRLTEPGDVVLTDAHTYPGFKALARALHLRLCGVQGDDEGLLPEAMEAACRARRPRALYTIPTIQNPTAGVLGTARREQIVGIARRHDVAIVEDDVHRLLHPDPPPSFVSLAPERTYSVASFSKVVCGGLRIAYLVAPVHEVERLSEVVWATTWMAAPLLAELASLWVHDGTAALTVEAKRAEARARQAIAARHLCGLPYRTAPNAYHLWLPLPPCWTPSEFALAAHRKGIEVTPASAFAVHQTSNDRFVRISLSGVDTRDELEEGLRGLAVLLEMDPAATGML